MTIFTLGHSNRPWVEFVMILKKYGIKKVADVRTIPRSKRNPQYDSELMKINLEAEGIEYHHLSGLGGWRKVQPDSINLGWKNLSFRGYADYMQTEEFKKSLDQLKRLAKISCTVIVCAEVTPWRCHRTLISDVLVSQGDIVIEIFDLDKKQNHLLSRHAVDMDGKVIYPLKEV